MQPDTTIAEAVAEIDRLRTENADLRRRVAELDGRINELYARVAALRTD
jgi:uncharacterized coiled-coil DUF342 family protein